MALKLVWFVALKVAYLVALNVVKVMAVKKVMVVDGGCDGDCTETGWSGNVGIEVGFTGDVAIGVGGNGSAEGSNKFSTLSLVSGTGTS